MSVSNDYKTALFISDGTMVYRYQHNIHWENMEEHKTFIPWHIHAHYCFKVEFFIYFYHFILNSTMNPACKIDPVSTKILSSTIIFNTDNNKKKDGC